MELYLISNIIICTGALLGSLYGVVKFFKPKKAVYLQMIALSAGCMALGRLYQVVRLVTIGDITENFQLGVLGVVGSLLFLFSTNFGVMDSLADDGSKRFLKYRLIALAAPATVTIVYLALFLFADLTPLVKIVSGVITAVTAGASYYNLKHLIFPDVDFGVINCLKGYNAAALALEALIMAEMLAASRGGGIASLVTGALLGLAYLAIVPVAERGVKKWRT